MNDEVPEKSESNESIPLQAPLLLLNVIFLLWYFICTIVIGIITVPIFICYYRGWTTERSQIASRRFIQFYGRVMIRLSWPMIRIRIENLKEVKKVEPCIYVLNHFSFADVFFCGFLPGYQTVIAIRSWPFKIPLFNLFMRRAGYLNVEDSSTEDTLINASKFLKSGACLLFFPEGHRSKNGGMLPLGKGAFRIAAENNVPIIPVALQGTEYLSGYKSRLLRPCKVIMRFFPPMKAETNNFSEVNKFRDNVKSLFLQEIYSK